MMEPHAQRRKPSSSVITLVALVVSWSVVAGVVGTQLITLDCDLGVDAMVPHLSATCFQSKVVELRNGLLVGIVPGIILAVVLAHKRWWTMVLLLTATLPISLLCYGRVIAYISDAYWHGFLYE